MSTSQIPIANAPCSWGVLEFGLPGKAAGYSQVLDEIKATGYSGTELGDWGFMPTDPDSLRRELDARQLQLLGAFVPIAFSQSGALAEGAARALKTARLMADAAGPTPFLVLADGNGKEPLRTKLAGRVQREHSLSAAQWKAYGQGINQVAEAIGRQTGLRTVFHHHCAGFVEAPWEIDTLLAATDPGLVGLCFDTGHYKFGGGDDAAGAFRRYRDRIWYVHFKDCNPAVRAQSREKGWDYFESLKHGIFCPLGKGDVDFPAVIRALRDAHYDGWIVVEQDVLPGMGEPKHYAAANREFLAKCGL